MSSNDKIRVAVLFGGRSTEHEVSVMSGANVIKNLDPTRFEVLPIRIDKQGAWFLESSRDLKALKTPLPTQKLFSPSWLNEPEVDPKAQRAEFRHFLKSQQLFDVAFPILHGTFSEDGTLQGLLDCADVPYVGSGVLASSVGMDKDFARRLVNYAGLPSVPYRAYKQADWVLSRAAVEAEVWTAFTLPLFVKPANQGSSIGVTKVKKKEDLAAAIDFALRYDQKILVEQGIAARELEVAILEDLKDGATPYASLVGEVCPKDEFYSYKAKYVPGVADFIIPAKMPEVLHAEVSRLAKEIFEILGAEGMARVDFFMDRETNQLYFNEINTIPGFTPTSMYPLMMVASGVSYPALLTQLVMLALKRHEKKKCLERNYTVCETALEA